jgi:plastocyanin
MSPPHRWLAALPAATVAAAATLLFSACSSSHPALQAPPRVNFGSASTTPGMNGGGTASASAAAAPSATGSPTEAPAPTGPNAFSINNFAFVPATLAVPVGTTATWTNHDEEPHTVVANDGSFHSPGLGANATFSHTFAAAGSFDYICSIHPFIHGAVVVTP